MHQTKKTEKTVEKKKNNDANIQRQPTKRTEKYQLEEEVNIICAMLNLTKDDKAAESDENRTHN